MADRDSPADVTYRRAVPADEPAVRAVLAFANMHHVPSPEMPELRLEDFFVAEHGGRLVGCAGWKVLADGRGKTTLMAVDPAARGLGIGQRLQELRMLELVRLGCRVLVTNTDLPETIAWYERKFGYRKVGTLPKEHEFSSPAIDHWTTLETDLVEWHRRYQTGRAGGPG